MHEIVVLNIYLCLQFNCLAVECTVYAYVGEW